MDQKKFQNENKLLGILSHQLKSPINSIESILKVIVDGFTGEIDEKTLYFIQKAINKTTDARNIITDMINYEKLSTMNEIIMEEIEIINFIHSLCRKYSFQASEKNILISTGIPENINIYIQAEPVSLGIAFGNLIDNAIKYTPNNGKITISIHINQEAKKCLVMISDSGYGINQEDIPKIFDPFFRSPGQKSAISGTGLGLSIVKKVIEKHNFEITVESRENAGTSFTVTIPGIKIKQYKNHKARDGKKIVIIGGVTAGPKAAARLRRLDESLDITIIEKSEFLSYAGCGLPAFISGKVNSPKELMSTSDNTLRDVNFFESIKNIKVLNQTEAIEINREKKTVGIKDLVNQVKHEVDYDILILATGSSCLYPDIPGIRQEGIYSLHSIEEAKKIKEELHQKRAMDIIIIGGGLIGIEVAESIMLTGARVTILEKSDQILRIFDKEISKKIEHELNKKGIKVYLSTLIKEIQKTEKNFIIKTEENDFVADMIILASGVKPNTALAEKSGLELGQFGGLKINEYFQTSDKNIYAIGDCIESCNVISGKPILWPLGSVSTKMGRIVADNICGKKVKFKGHAATAMFKLFDFNIARTGLSLQDAVNSGYDVESIVVSGLDCSHYCGEAQEITLKLLVDRKTEAILGAQGYGRGNIVERIEMLAFAVTQGLKLNDVYQVDLGYYPYYNNPIDLIQTACIALKNKIDGLYRTITCETVEAGRNGYKFIDVSPASENHILYMSNSINIPLENIREEKIPYKCEDQIVLFSRTSARAYEAYRYLVSKGFQNIFVLEGGYLFYK